MQNTKRVPFDATVDSANRVQLWPRDGADHDPETDHRHREFESGLRLLWVARIAVAAAICFGVGMLGRMLAIPFPYLAASIVGTYLTYWISSRLVSR